MKTFGHQRPVRNSAGEIIGLVDCPSRAITHGALGSNYGPDEGRKLIVSLEAGDLICFRPAATRRTYRVVASDVFAWIIRSEANRIAREKALDKKNRRLARLAALRIKRNEKKLFSTS